LLPLHASAVCIDGRGVAVLGRSGAGKSTLAACLLGRGHDLIADDVCVLDEMECGIAVSPGVCRLRLSEQASTLSKPLGHYASGKYEVSVARRISEQVPLRHLFVLEECSEDKPIALEREQADSALGLLLEHIYRSEFSMYMGCMGETFRLSAATVNTIPLSIIRRPRAFSRLHDVARQIEKETNSA
jgi:energy-coupling factor transporter ATP-binding protein EcfA2